MTLNYQLRQEDAVASNLEYRKSSPTHREMKTRVRLAVPVLMLVLWAYTKNSSEFNWPRAVIYLGIGLIGFFFYPAYFDERQRKHTARLIAEGSRSNSMGPCELTLAEDGLHYKSDICQKVYLWSALDKVVLTDAYLFIFLTDRSAFPIWISDVGSDAAKAAYDYLLSHMPPKGEPQS